MKSVTYDLHVHSCLSPCGDAEMTPNNIAGLAMLNGVKVVALTDHNTSKNCPAFFEACRRYGVIPIAGMELTTAEDIHMVCLFPTLEDAMDFDTFIESHRMKIANRPEIFGEQLILNGDDEVVGREEGLLIAATDLDITTAARIVRERGGAAYPAHIDKQANSMIETLGDFPSEPGFAAAELRDISKLHAMRKKYPILEGLIAVADSDAHFLEGMSMNPSVFPFAFETDDEDTVRRGIIAALRGELK